MQQEQKGLHMTSRMLLHVLLVAIFLSGVAAVADDQMTGMFRLTRQTTEIVEPQMADALAKVISKDEQLKWQVFVPESYNSANPAGLFLYIDATGDGRIPDEWQQVFANRNLIWVGVPRMKNNTPEVRRLWESVLGSRAVTEDYAIDMRRMYVGGAESTVFTALNTMLTANEFTGAVYVRGSYHSEDFGPDTVQALQRKRHVFISGTDDKYKGGVRSDFKKYKEDGIANSKLIFATQRLGKTPAADLIEEAVGFLDAR